MKSILLDTVPEVANEKLRTKSKLTRINMVQSSKKNPSSGSGSKKTKLPSLRQLPFLVLALAALFGAGEFLPGIQQKKSDYHLILDPPEEAPPALVMTSTALGGFRGLVLDYLWIRAGQLREDGSHYEIVQLYSWICKLEPRIAEVWEFTAHEMAYNISVTLPSGEERWRWVYKGIEQIRDLGLQFNPKAPRLYSELAEIFLNKMGQESFDVSHFYYQVQWAKMMQEVLGKDQDLQELIDAPRTLNALLANAKAKVLYQAAGETEQGMQRAVFYREKLSAEQKKEFDELLAKPGFYEAFRQMSAYVRNKRLRQEYKLSPKRMLKIEMKYGNIDWRVTAAHALYWIEQEIEVIATLPEKERPRSKNVDIFRHASLSEIFESGTIVQIGEERLICLPNFAVVDSLNRLFEEIDKYRHLGQGHVSHEEFLNRVVFIYYMYNGIDRKLMGYCLALVNKFPSRYGDKFPSRFPKDEREQIVFENSIKKYVVEEIGKRLVDKMLRHQVESLIVAQLINGYRYFYRGNDSQGVYSCNFAAEIYKVYVKRHGNLSRIRKDQKPRNWEYFKREASGKFKQELYAICPPLFRVESSFETFLDAENFPEELWRAFIQHGEARMPEDAKVRIAGKGRWYVIEDETPRFIIVKNAGKLLVLKIKTKEESEGEFAAMLKRYKDYLTKPD